MDEVRISRIYNWMKQYVDDGKIPFAQVHFWSWALVLVALVLVPDLLVLVPGLLVLALGPIGRGLIGLFVPGLRLGLIGRGLGLLRPLLLSFLGLSL